MAKIPKKEKQINNQARAKKLLRLLSEIDSPNEGDEVTFTLKDNPIIYKGIIQKKSPAKNTVHYIILSKGRKAPKGIIETISYNNRVFTLKGEK